MRRRSPKTSTTWARRSWPVAPPGGGAGKERSKPARAPTGPPAAARSRAKEPIQATSRGGATRASRAARGRADVETVAGPAKAPRGTVRR